MAVQVKVVSVSFAASFAPGRIGRRDAIVAYTVNGGAALTVTLPAENLTGDAVDAAIAADVKARAAIVGRTLSV